MYEQRDLSNDVPSAVYLLLLKQMLRCVKTLMECIQTSKMPICRRTAVHKTPLQIDTAFEPEVVL
jgi:hypothetical protein